MAFRDLLSEEQLRLRLLFGIMLIAFGVLLAALWRMQVAHGTMYQRDLVRQSVRRVRLPGMRGRIFDRAGRCLADNRPSYCVAIYLEELRRPGKWDRTIDRVDALIDRLAGVLELPRQVEREDIRTHIRKRLPLPFTAWRDVDEIAIARLAENVSGEPGVDIVVEAVREYPYDVSACHLLGYVGRAEQKQAEDEPYHYYLPEMGGKAGLEKTFDGVLRGEPGGRLVRVDVSGFRHDDLAEREPHNGMNLKLTLDLGVQEAVEKALQGRPGAAVVVDPRNGDVLAMASVPGFDLNDFTPAISSERWKTLMEDAAHPLVNRTVAGAYAPGSTFKPVVALAAVENDKGTPQTSFSCPGYFTLGSARFNCWYHRGHGLLDMEQALEHSCNVYFFRLGLQCGPEPISHMATALGFGRKTELAVDYEVAGLVPNDAWKRRTQNDGWRDGDTCNMSIGQGALLVTPVQMAMYTAAIANSGRLYRPRVVSDILDDDGAVVRSFPAKVVNELNWTPRAIRTVRAGMRDVVMAPRGTGRLAAVPGVDMAGKTGTAEVGRKEEGRKLGWMIAFAPFDDPRYAVVVMVEDAVSGGVTAAPVMKAIMSHLFDAGAGEGSG